MIRLPLLVASLLLTLLGATSPSRVDDQSPASQLINNTKIDLPPPPISLNQQLNAFIYARQAIEEQCQAQPSDLWCQDIKLPEQTQDASAIASASMSVKDLFVYLNDVEDTWRVHSSQVLLGQTWKGDCDDLASTTLDILIRQGQPRSKAWLLLVNVDGPTVFDHLVAMVQDNQGHYWIVGDTSSRNAYPLSQLNYTVVAVARADNMKSWTGPQMLQIFPTRVTQGVLVPGGM